MRVFKQFSRLFKQGAKQGTKQEIFKQYFFKKLISSLLTLSLLGFISVGSSLAQANIFEEIIEGNTYTETKYPIVLVHGVMGFDRVNFLGLDFLNIDYWPNVAEQMMRSGATVYTIQVSAVHLVEVRGEQLVRQLETLKALTGAEKFNLFGHSMGSPTSRYAAGVRPDLVASVSSIGGSNDSNERDNPNPADDIQPSCDATCIAFQLLAFAGGITTMQERCTRDIDSTDARLQEAARISCEAVNKEVALSGLPLAADQRIVANTQKESFNRTFNMGRPAEWCGSTPSPIAEDGIYYYSWSGVKINTNFLDVSDIAMGFLGRESIEAGEQTDGLVERCQSHWGVVIRDDYPMNHLDETNLFFGLVQPFFSVTSLFRQQANRLKKVGL